jgi:hypothetical protein
MVICLGTSLCFLELGCSGIGGLRSIGIDPAGFLGFRNRGPGSPLPENDLYVQAMNAPRVGSTESAKSAKKDAEGGKVEQAPAAPVIRSADERDGSPRDGHSPSASDPTGDDSITVSLGAPEPLPALVRETAPPENLASTNGRARWRAETTGPASDALPGLISPADRDTPERQTPAQLALEPRPGVDSRASALLAQAQRNLRALKTYQAKITRQERVQDRLQPEEEILLSIRSEPRAVRVDWTSGPSKGREVIYSSTLDPHMMFVHQPGAALVVPAMKVAIDSPLVTRNSRHSIAEAGFDTILASLHGSKNAADQSRIEGAALNYEPPEAAPGIDRPCHHFIRRTESGETWNVYLDTQSLLPRLVVAKDSHGDLIERYVYSQIRENPSDLSLPNAFDPGARWGDSKGLISRLARAAAAASNLPDSASSATR